MKILGADYSVEPDTASGRDDWWHVRDGFVLWMLPSTKMPAMEDLEKYIAARAERGCADCISAIMECSEDVSLQAAVAGTELWT